MKVSREPDGTLLIDDLTALYADILLRVPEFLELDDPRVKKRLFPEVYDDEQDVEQWRRYAGTEIEHLFQNRKQALAQDLETLERLSARRFRMWISRGHEKLWLQSLNAARLAIFEQNDLRQEHMEMDPAEAKTEELELALVRIHVLAHVQEVLIRT